MRFDELGNRMKQYEYQTTCTKLIPNLPVYARIDGRCFHKFCKGLNKPFDECLVQTMQEVCKFLVEETNAQLGYVQSDEISLCWLTLQQAPFNGKLFKLQSVLAGMATSKFVTYITENYYNALNHYNSLNDIGDPHCENYYWGPQCTNWYKLYDKCRKLNPHFDCRVFQLPDVSELANCFIWRELDATRNSISMLAQANFSHKQLQGIDCNGMQNMLLQEKQINWNELPDDLKRGTYYKKINYTKTLTDQEWNKIPDNKKPESRDVIRSQVSKIVFPIMSKVDNKIGVYFLDEKPRFKKG